MLIMSKMHCMECGVKFDANVEGVDGWSVEENHYEPYCGKCCVVEVVEPEVDKCLACNNTVQRHEDFCTDCYSTVTQTELDDSDLPF